MGGESLICTLSREARDAKAANLPLSSKLQNPCHAQNAVDVSDGFTVKPWQNAGLT